MSSAHYAMEAPQSDFDNGYEDGWDDSNDHLMDLDDLDDGFSQEYAKGWNAAKVTKQADHREAEAAE